MARILQSSSQLKITRTLEMKMWDAKACLVQRKLSCTKKTATPGSSTWILPCFYSLFLITHLCLSHRIVTWIHFHVPVKICDNTKDTVLTQVLQEDCHQDATKFPVSYHQVSLLLCDFFMPVMEQLLSAKAEQDKMRTTAAYAPLLPQTKV